jgi:hypothetical protein
MIKILANKFCQHNDQKVEWKIFPVAVFYFIPVQETYQACGGLKTVQDKFKKFDRIQAALDFR